MNVSSGHSFSLRKYVLTLYFLWGLASLVSAQKDERIEPSIASPLLQQTSPEAITAELGQIDAILRDSGPWLEPERLAQVYRGRQYQPIFVGSAEELKRGDALVRELRESGSHGLSTSRYRLEELETLLGGLPRDAAPWWAQWFRRKDPRAARSLARLELILSDRYLAFASDLNNSSAPSRRPETEGAPADTLVASLVSSNLPPVESWAPTHPQYEALLAARETYRRIATGGGWPAVDAGETLKPGGRDPRVVQLRARLNAEAAALPGSAPGGLEPAGDPMLFEPILEKRVREFQARNGLDVDGAVGKGTLAELNVSAADRLRQIEITQARWREGPRREPPHRVEVNIPGMTVYFFHDGEPRLALKTVVGSGRESGAWKGKTSKAETPELVDVIETIEVNPRWYIPEIIVRTELLAKERRKPGYLDRGGYEWYDPKTGAHGPASSIPESDWGDPTKRLNLRQKSGGQNSLGRIKFVFHNRYAVYLHDTPEKHLFKKGRRNFSHGCVRVETPAVLAESLLAYSSRKAKKPIEEMMADTARVVITLKPPVPIHLVYRTVWVQDDGAVSFFPDLYGSDPEAARKLLAANAAEPGERSMRMPAATERSAPDLSGGSGP